MAKDLQYYLGLKYPVVISEGIENGRRYIEAEIPELPGCGSFGETVEEALYRLEEARELWMKARLKRGLLIPEPVSEEDFSGKFLLRIPPELHRKLATGAKSKSLSLNQYVRKVLEDSISITAVLERMEELEQKIASIGKAIEKPEAVTVADFWSRDPVRTGWNAFGIQVHFAPGTLQSHGYGMTREARRQGLDAYSFISEEA